MAQLLIPGDTTPHDLPPEGVTIGRGDTNDIVIPDDGVSGLHAEIRLDGETYQVRDLGSSNGTRVNGNRISQSELRDRDIVAFGPIQCAFFLAAKTPAEVPVEPAMKVPEPEPAPAKASVAAKLGGFFKGVLRRPGK
ncbi:MAG: FHA domain-containing protein [Chthoniobacterales bacterium]